MQRNTKSCWEIDSIHKIAHHTSVVWCHMQLINKVNELLEVGLYRYKPARMSHHQVEKKLELVEEFKEV